MIYLRITDLLLSPPVTHTTTDWQVAEDLLFTTITVQSLGDSTNLTSMLFDTALDPAIKYYARSRVLLSTGYTAWSNIDIFSPDDVSDATINAPLPSLVSIPTITITNSGMNVPTMGTTISLSPVITLGGASHESTSYVVENIDGSVVWSDLRTVTDRLTKTIPPTVLVPNTVYRIRVMVHTDSEDTTQLLSTTIKTAARTKGLIMSGLLNVAPNTPLVVDVVSGVTLTGVTGALYAITGNLHVLVGTYPAGGILNNIITVPAIDLHPVTKYLLRVTTSDTGTWDQRIFTTTL